MKRRILLVLTVCLAFCLLTGGIPTKRFGMGRPFNMAPFGMVDECDANWKPTDISGCILDLDSRKGITPSLTDATLCSVLTSQAPGGRYLATAGPSTCPVITPNVLNGQQGLVFGADDYLFRSAAGFADVSQPLTIFLIASLPPQDGIRYLYSAGTSWYLYTGLSTTYKYRFAVGTTGSTGSTALAAGTFVKIRMVASTGANGDSLFVNGVKVSSGDYGSGDLTGMWLATGFTLGNYAANTFCRLILYNKAIATGSADLAKLNAYFLKTYGL